MQAENKIRYGRPAKGMLALVAGLLFAASTASAQVSSYGEKQMGEPASDHLPAILNKATIVQKLNTQLPLDAQFVDETGKSVRLRDYFGKRPAILSLVYYNCPMLCSEELNGLVDALQIMKFQPSKNFNVIVASINPNETPKL